MAESASTSGAESYSTVSSPPSVAGSSCDAPAGVSLVVSDDAGASSFRSAGGSAGSTGSAASPSGSVASPSGSATSLSGPAGSFSPSDSSLSVARSATKSLICSAASSS